MKHLAFSRMQIWILYSLLVSMVTSCMRGIETPGQVIAVNPTEVSPSLSWEVYTNETWGFSLEHPNAWVVSANGTESGFIGKQVFWWAGNYDPMQQHGDDPAVDQITETDLSGQRAKRVLGHYQGAIADMGFQKYLRYVIRKGDVFFMFTLFAFDALGVPPGMMAELQPLHETDVALFEQMMATLKFDR